MITIIRIRLLHVENDAAEEGVVVVAHILAFPVAETGLGTGRDAGGGKDLRAVFVGVESFGEDEELEAHADLSDVLGDGETRVGAEGAGGGECGEGFLVAHGVPETGVDAVADLGGFA